MRGIDYNQSKMFSFLSPEERIPSDHPLRKIRLMCDQALRQLSAEFASLYSSLGRSSVAPEKLLRALLLQVLFSIRSERLLMEQMNYNLLFRWFVGLSMDEEVWDATVFSKNRGRLERGNIAQKLLQAVLQQAAAQELLSDEHFTVDGTLLEAWASMRSYQKKDEPPTEGSGSRGEILLRDTHECKTDPDAQMYRKSKASAFQLCHMAHVLMENRNGLAVAGRVTTPLPQSEWEAALDMLNEIPAASHATVGADKAYDEAVFVRGARNQGVTPHVAQYDGEHRSSNIDGRTTRHAGYEISLAKRKRIEPIFSWLKNTGLMRKLRHRGHTRVRWMFLFAVTAFNLVRLRKLTVQTA